MTDAIYQFEWLQRFSSPVAAAVAAAEFQRIELAEGGLTPRAVVDASRPEDAPLHGLFEWDDRKAAESWRIDQARTAISSLRVVVREGELPAPAFASVRVRDEDDEPRSTFVGISDIERNADLRENFLLGELRNLDGILQRTVGFEEMEPLRKAAREVRRALRPAIEVAATAAD